MPFNLLIKLNIHSLLQSKFWSLSFLSALFIVLNGLLFFKIGIKVVNDSPRYLNYVEILQTQGFFFDPHNFWYISYPIFIMLAKTIHDSLEMVIIFQYLLSFGALFAIYQTSFNMFKNHFSAFLTGFLYILFFEISLYNSYILCESFFTSLTCFSLFFLSKWYKNEISPFNLLIGVTVLLFAILAKPTGIVILISIASFWVFKLFEKLRKTFWKIFFVLITAIPMLLLVNKMLTTFGFINEYIKGDIIYGIFLFKNSSFYDLLSISRPDSLFIPDADYSPLIRLMLFIVFNPVYWGLLFFGKVFYFFSHIRPFWSLWHNIFSLGYLIPVYFFSIKAITSEKIEIKVKTFILVFVLSHAAIIRIMTEDWDGRFLIPVLPVLLISAGLGTSLAFGENRIIHSCI